jgi:SAF domain
VGVLLVLGCALAFVDASLHLGSREEVLVVSQPVAAGQVLTTADLRAARVSTGSGLDVVLSGEEATVVGRHAAVPLVPGALLTASEVGSVPEVGSGFDVVAVGVKAGAYPPELVPGDRTRPVRYVQPDPRPPPHWDPSPRPWRRRRFLLGIWSARRHDVSTDRHS